MSLREIERASIRGFLEENTSLIVGDTLDFGCGLQPYRDVVTRAGATYWGYDSERHPGTVVSKSVGRLDPPNEFWDTVICTQVLQYVHSPMLTLREIHMRLKIGGWLLMTGPTNWPHIEADDKWRFTTSGMMVLLHDVGFTQITVAPRGEITFENERWSIGWQARAQV